MTVSIRHETRYEYSRSVVLEPHTVRLHPRAGFGLRILGHRLEVEPEPAGQSISLDLDGNAAHHLWFSGTCDSLTIVSETEVECYPYNPFNFLVAPATATVLPVMYPVEVLPVITAYLTRCSNTVPVTAFATSIAQEVDRHTVAFLSLLTQRIHRLVERVDRPHGPPLPPQRTLDDLRGSCRDLAVVFIDACRSVGLAARFVSGYVLDETRDEARELHAWAEVYLPGAGWRGFDPSQGVAVGNRHLAVAAGRISSLAAPVTGQFRGTGARATMSAAIQVIERNQMLL